MGRKIYFEDNDPYFLEKLGFEQREQSTTDSNRYVEYFMVLPSENKDIWLELVVVYDLFITDDPGVSYLDNLNWSFEGVYLKIISQQKREKYDQFRQLIEGMEENSEDFLRNGMVARIKLKLETHQDVKKFLSYFEKRGKNQTTI